MSNDRFIYDEKTSRLYAPDGSFLKEVYCPKALSWNQLVVEDGQDRWRGCGQCHEKVFNLDVADVAKVMDEFRGRWTSVCVHASRTSDKVVFLKDDTAPPPADAPNLDDRDRVIIRTARTIDDINRAVGLGYWPDVRVVVFDTKNIRQKISVGQDQKTGRVEVSGDFRRSFRGGDFASRSDQFKEVVPFTGYYPNYQQPPVAAYLIPRDIPDGTAVLVADPIEDIVGGTWNQGSAWRAENVPGYISKRKVVLEPGKINVAECIG